MPAADISPKSHTKAAVRFRSAAKHALQISDLRRDLQQTLPLGKIIDVLNEAAQAGEPWAVALWLACVCGRPSNQNELGDKAAPSARRLTDEELLEILARHGALEPAGGTASHPAPTEETET